MEGDLLGLDLAVLDLYLVPREDDGDVLAHPGKVAVPVGDVLVGDAAGNVEHDDGALALDVVAVAEATELLLAGRVPDVELDGTAVGVEGEGMDLNAQGGDVLLLELPGEVALHEGRLAHPAVADEDELELGSLLLSLGRGTRARGGGWGWGWGWGWGGEGEVSFRARAGTRTIQGREIEKGGLQPGRSGEPGPLRRRGLHRRRTAAARWPNP